VKCILDAVLDAVMQLFDNHVFAFLKAWFKAFTAE